MKLKLSRPLVVFDIESTGTNPRMDRIIDLALVRLMPDGTREEHTFRVNPGIPIPRETTAIHGITDADVKDAPPFAQIAPEVARLLTDVDLAGYNMIRFDLPLLAAEFKRADVDFDTDGFRLVDMQRIFHTKEPRDLTAALKFYSGEMHMGAHGALDDVLATIRVFEGQLERYPDLPTDLDELHAFCNPKHRNWIDQEGRLHWVHGEAAINFGKYQGRSLKSLVAKEAGFLNWILQNEFPEDTKKIIKDALNGTYPTPPADPAK